MLPLYARRFSCVELNYTWYQMPRADAVDRQRVQVPDTFLFSVKLTRTMTHEIDPGRWRRDTLAFREGVAPLVQSGQLAAVLIQLPPAFDRSRAHRRHLAALMDALEGLPLAVEFRHRSWAEDRVFAELERRKIALVAVDVPDLPALFPALDAVTHPGLFYVRFHGRNDRGWRTGHMQHQFDYLYSDAELQEWIDRRVIPMSRKARRGMLFFNNHVRGQAVRNALRMAELLNRQGIGVQVAQGGTRSRQDRAR